MEKLERAMNVCWAEEYGLDVDDPDFYEKLDMAIEKEPLVIDIEDIVCPHCGQELGG